MKNLILLTLFFMVFSLSFNFVRAQEPGVVADVANGDAVHAKSENGVGVNALSENNHGVKAESKSQNHVSGLFVNNSGTALHSTGKLFGGWFLSDDGIGIRAESKRALYAGGYFINNEGWGIEGRGKIFGGMLTSNDGIGLRASSTNAAGIYATSENQDGIRADSNSPNRFGGLFINTNPTGIGVYGIGGKYAGFFEGDVGVTKAVTAQNFSQSSDRNLKSNFASINGQDVLKKLMTIPIQRWNYKNESTSVLHIGPMAQDFSKAFGVGYDDKTISTVDANGVALAAIQGLYEMIQEKDKQITELAKEVEALKKKSTGKASAKKNRH